MKAYSIILKLLLTLTLLGLMQVSYADNKDKVSLEQASETIRKQTQGKVLSATTKIYNGVESHRIQVLTKSGRVKIYQVPVNKNDTQKRSNNSQNRNNNSNNYRNQKPNNRYSNQDKKQRQTSQSRSKIKRDSNNRNRLKTQNKTQSKKSSSNGDNKKQ